MNWKRIFYASNTTQHFSQSSSWSIQTFQRRYYPLTTHSLPALNEIYLGLSFSDIIKITLNVIFSIHLFVGSAHKRVEYIFT